MDNENYEDTDDSENNSEHEDQDSENTEDKSEDMENSDDENKGSEDDESKSSEEEDPYEARLKQLEKENEELKKNKTLAIKSEREKRQAAEAKLKEQNQNQDDEDKPMTRKEFEELMKKREDAEKIKNLTPNESEQKLIRKYVDLGYSVDDAYLKANAHIIEEHKQAEREREQSESFVAGFSRAVPRGKSGSPAYATDPIKRAAADGLTPEERKYL